jgi:hypothetical protein
MEIRESICNGYETSLKKYFYCMVGGAILGSVIAIGGFVRDFYQNQNIPGVNQASKSNLAIVLTGVSVIAASTSIPLALSKRAKRKKDSELESLSDSSSDLTGIGLPYLP